ncbi:MAG TPA: enoyl-CoA hydratase [Acidimicrobiales bacterium]|nr:enoyl-CoA hydratase [Acidimicrobiales bacterium]
MSTETIIVERAEGIVTVTLNRPERKNAGNGLMWQELIDMVGEVARRREDRVVVLTGAGGAFCSGADIADPSGVSGDPADPHLVRMRFFGQVMLALHRLPKPTIAKVRGIAAGAGMSLALACDLTVASDNARFSEIFAKRGLSVDGGSSWLLPRLIGLHKAKELAYFADILSAQEAADVGLVNRVVPDAELDAFVGEWARRLAAGPPIALSMTKALLDNAMSVTMAQALEDEARCQTVNFFTEDTAEAMRAFAEKREPNFKGR